MAFSIFLVGCTADPHTGGNYDPSVVGDAEMLFSVNLPGDFNTSGTRAMSIANENAINAIYVLIFDEHGFLLEIKKANSRGGNSYAIGLPATVEGTRVKLTLLANAEDILTGSVGLDPDSPGFPAKDYSTLMPLISEAVAGPLFTDADSRIPMWGEIDDIEIRTGTQSANVSLMRSVARIDVGVGKYTRQVDGTFVWNGLTAATGDPAAQEIPFRMTAVYLVKPNDHFSVAPVLGNVSFSSADGKPKATSPSVPPGTGAFDTFHDQSSENLFRFDIENGLKYTTREIYIPESDIRNGGSNAHRDRTAIVVAGYYADDANETYYRVDFADGENLHDVLRNHLYTFSIINVIDSGHPTVEAAYNSRSMNMTVDVLDWDQGVINNIWFEGVNYFAIDRQTVMFNPLPGETLTMTIRTNISDFYFTHANDPAELVRLSTDGPWFFDGEQRYGYQFTLIKDEESQAADDQYILQIYNPRDNIGETPEDRSIDWLIHALNMKIHFNVNQRHSLGEISLENGEGRFLPPEGNAASPIGIEIYSPNPVEISATEYVNGVTQPAAWIDLGDTSSLQHSGGAGIDYFYYKKDLVIAPFKYGENYDGTADRTATINIYIPATGANVNYRVTQQAPYVRIDRETVSAARPLSGTGSSTVEVLVYTNIKPGDLLVTKQDGGNSRINLLGDGTLAQTDPRNPGNRSFNVGVIFDPGVSGSYGADFVVSDRYGSYGDMPEEPIRVVVPPANQIFDAFWFKATFGTGGGHDPDTDWLPAPITSTLGGSNYVFPWNTSSILFDGVSNIGLEPDPEHMTAADIARLNDPEPVDYDTNGTKLYKYIYTPEKGSYVSTSSHRLAFISTLQPDLVTGEVDFKLGLQVFKVGENAYGSRRFTWEGRSGNDPGVIEITDNVSWRTDVMTDPYGAWFRVRAENQAGVNTGDFAAAGFFEMDDRVYQPIELAPGAAPYENSSTTMLVNNTELQFIIDPLDFYDPANPMQPESRVATVNIVNRDYDPDKLGASNPAPIVITQYNRVLQSQGVPAGLPPVTIPLLPAHMAQTYTFTARTNLDPIWLDIWEVDESGVKVGSAPVSRVIHTTGFDPSNSARPTQIAGVSLPKPELVQRNLLIALSAPGLTDAQEQKLGVWIQPSSNKHPTLPRTTTGILAPPGVLGVDIVTGQLTLRGSKEYAGTELETYSEFGALSENTVYVAMFKRGSLVGLSSYQDAAGAQTVAYSGVRDVIWAGPDYSDDETLKAMTWAAIPKAEAGYPTNGASNRFGDGIGDPCGFADGYAGDGPWMTPKATTAYVTIPPNNSIDTGTGAAYMFNGFGVWGGLPMAVYGSYYQFPDGGRLYLPTIGSRAENGAYNKFMNWGLDGHTLFWVAPEGDNDNTFLYLNLRFNSSATEVLSSDDKNIALPIRCVRK